MTFIFTLFLFALVCYLGDKAAKQDLALRWVRSSKKYFIQYRSFLGVWLPYGGNRMASADEADAWIRAEMNELYKMKRENLGRPHLFSEFLGIREDAKESPLKHDPVERHFEGNQPEAPLSENTEEATPREAPAV